jgi:hypothetical protein
MLSLTPSPVSSPERSSSPKNTTVAPFDLLTTLPYDHHLVDAYKALLRSSAFSLSSLHTFLSENPSFISSKWLQPVIASYRPPLNRIAWLTPLTYATSSEFHDRFGQPLHDTLLLFLIAHGAESVLSLSAVWPLAFCHPRARFVIDDHNRSIRSQ